VTWLILHDREDRPVLVALDAIRVVRADPAGSGLSRIDLDDPGHYVLVTESVTDIGEGASRVLNGT
jgi:hypothetical protein